MLAKIFRANLDNRIDELGINLDDLNKKDFLNLDSPKQSKKTLEEQSTMKKQTEPPGYLSNTKTRAIKTSNLPNRSQLARIFKDVSAPSAPAQVTEIGKDRLRHIIKMKNTVTRLEQIQQAMQASKNPFSLTNHIHLESRPSLYERGKKYAKERRRIVAEDLENSCFFKSTDSTTATRRRPATA